MTAPPFASFDRPESAYAVPFVATLCRDGSAIEQWTWEAVCFEYHRQRRRWAESDTIHLTSATDWQETFALPPDRAAQHGKNHQKRRSHGIQGLVRRGLLLFACDLYGLPVTTSMDPRDRQRFCHWLGPAEETAAGDAIPLAGRTVDRVFTERLAEVIAARSEEEQALARKIAGIVDQHARVSAQIAELRARIDQSGRDALEGKRAGLNEQLRDVRESLASTKQERSQLERAADRLALALTQQGGAAPHAVLFDEDGTTLWARQNMANSRLLLTPPPDAPLIERRLSGAAVGGLYPSGRRSVAACYAWAAAYFTDGEGTVDLDAAAAAFTRWRAGREG